MAIDKYILKDGSVRYRATTYVKNERVQKRGFLKKKDAQRWIDHTRVAGRVERPITFNEMADEFLEAYEPTVKPSTFYNATRNLRHARAAWGNKKIGAITGADAQRLTNQLAKDYISFDVIISQTSLVFTHAIAAEIIDRNPFEKVRKPRAKTEGGHRHKLWTIDELNRFLAACQKADSVLVYPMFHLLAYSGIRRGEMLALEFSDLNGDMLTINKTLTYDETGTYVIGPPKNNASYRTIALNTETVRLLNELKELVPGPRFFPVSTTAVYDWMNKYADLAGVPRNNPHNFRHLHCTMLINAGVPLKDVQERLGHSDIKMTLSVYAHANEDKHVSIDAISDYIYTGHYTE